ncbi:hypothetical protein M9Y10_017557 [Tritrichomonas musculus]|uniref:Uncharacterized protein n=1 Tax=Tritrichomonas musculus TaxID=1915356 RepID=A0ABR2HTW7_9EUKA
MPVYYFHFLKMSENQVLNSTPSNSIRKLSPTRRIPSSPKSSNQMDAALEKQKQILEQYKETNTALSKYKEKTEESITQSKKVLDEEKAKTNEMINDIVLKNEEMLNQKKSENDKKIQELKESPLFDSEPIQSMKNSFSEMKSNVEEIKNDFSQNFQNFMNDFHSIQSQALSKKIQKSNINDVKDSIANLQKAIEDKRDNDAIKQADYLNSRKLSLSENSITYNQMPNDSIDYVERSIELSDDELFPHTPHINAFLKKFCAKNAKWLD